MKPALALFVLAYKKLKCRWVSDTGSLKKAGLNCGKRCHTPFFLEGMGVYSVYREEYQEYSHGFESHNNV
jgi:hypothetical protein